MWQARQLTQILSGAMDNGAMRVGEGSDNLGVAGRIPAVGVELAIGRRGHPSGANGAIGWVWPAILQATDGWGSVQRGSMMIGLKAYTVEIVYMSPQIHAGGGIRGMEPGEGDDSSSV